MNKYLNERRVRKGVELETARRECVDRERWRLFCHGHPLGDTPGGSEACELLIGSLQTWRDR